MYIFIELLPRLPLYVLILLSTAGVVFGDYSAKTWSLHQKPLWLVLAFVGYIIASFFYIPSLMKEGLVVTSVLWSLTSSIGFLIIGFFIFQETLNAWQIVGAVLGIVALLLFAAGN